MTIKRLEEVYLEELIHRIRFSWKKPSDQQFDKIRIYYALYDTDEFFHYIDINPEYNSIDLAIIGLADPEPLDNIPIYNDIIQDGVRYDFKVVGVYNNEESNGLVISGSALSGFKLYKINQEGETNVVEFNDIDQIPDIEGNNFTISGLELGKLYNIIPTSYIIAKDGTIIESSIDYLNSKSILSYPKPFISNVQNQNGYVNIFFPEVIADGEEIYLIYNKIKGSLDNYILLNANIIQINNNSNQFKASVFLENNQFLQTDIEYDYILKASSRYGISEPSDSVSGMIYPGIPSLPIISISISDISYSSVIMSWIDNENQFEDLKGYIISYDGIDISVNSTIKSYILTNLQPKTLYTISIKTYNFYGNSSSIDTSFITLMDPIIYTFTSNIQQLSIQLSRNIRSDEQIKVIYTGNNKIKEIIQNTNISQFNLNGLYGGTNYSINIELKDINTNQIINSNINIKTGEKIPSTPFINLSRYNKKSIEVKWYTPGTII